MILIRRYLGTFLLRPEGKQLFLLVLRSVLNLDVGAAATRDTFWRLAAFASCQLDTEQTALGPAIKQNYNDVTQKLLLLAILQDLLYEVSPGETNNTSPYHYFCLQESQVTVCAANIPSRC